MAKISYRNSTDRRGMLTVVQLVTVTFFAVLAMLMLHVVTVVKVKIHSQNAADTSARAAVTVMARSMNALCATNHLIGEATAMLAVHEAIAGPRPGSVTGNTVNHDIYLDAGLQELLKAIASPPPDPTPAWYTAAALARPFAYPEVRQQVRAAATVLIGKRYLKRELGNVYFEKATALRAINIPRIIERNKLEQKILDEYTELTRMRQRAASQPVVDAIGLLKDKTLPQLRDYTRLLVKDTPGLANEAARQVGVENGVDIQLYPTSPQLPVQQDPLAKAHNLDPIEPHWYGSRKPTETFPRPSNVADTKINRRQIKKITQLCRATYPWVNYHREPVWQHFAKKCPLSTTKHELGDIYRDETADATLRICGDLQENHGYGLYVLRRATFPDKGYENWTDDPADLESLFSVVSIAGRLEGSASNEQSTGYFSKFIPYRLGATARSILYSSKTQAPHKKRIDLTTKRIIPVRQPKTGWDTLQWKGKEEGMPYELVVKGEPEDGYQVFPEFPEIEVGWQAKLVPLAPGRVEELQTEAEPRVEAHKLPREVKFLRKFTPLATH